MTTLYLIRHGETDYNTQGVNRYCGSTDLELNSLGVWQAQRLAEAFRPIQLDAVYSSPLWRARQTARYLGEGRTLPVHTEQELAERGYGRWEGKTVAELRQEEAQLYTRFESQPASTRPPEGETGYELLERALRVVSSVVMRHEGRPVALVGHGTLNRALLCHYLSIPLDHYRRIGQSNGALNVIEFQDGSPRVTLINDTSHLLAHRGR